jgi:hypothetical protein
VDVSSKKYVSIHLELRREEGIRKNNWRVAAFQVLGL